MIKEFRNDEGIKCGFWDFSKKMRDNGHRLNMYILTTSIIHEKCNEEGDIDSVASNVSSESETNSIKVSRDSVDNAKTKDMKKLQDNSEVYSVEDKIIAKITWKHRASNSGKFHTISMGDEVTIRLDPDVEYSLDNLKNVIVEECRKHSDAQNFMNSCLVKLGYGEDQIIYEFTNQIGANCNFWQFSRKLRDKRSGNQLHLYVLTTSLSKNIKIDIQLQTKKRVQI